MPTTACRYLTKRSTGVSLFSTRRAEGGADGAPAYSAADAPSQGRHHEEWTGTERLMGGQGSGGHNSKGKRRDVQCARLDVHELTREGKLKLGTRGRLFGVIGFE